MHGLRETSSPLAWTMECYGAGPDWSGQSDVYGCFRFEYVEPDQAIKLHFYNRDPHPHGPLSDEALPERTAELTAMFAEIKRRHPEARTVRGHSWVYNLERYRRQFPPSYTAHLHPDTPSFNGSHVWGQFLKRDKSLNLSLAEPFVHRADAARSLQGLLESFPYKTLCTEGPISDFYAFYGLS